MKINNRLRKVLLFLMFILIIILIILLINNKSSNSIKNIGKKKKKDNVKIPDGFYYVGGSAEDGLVISDDKSDENMGTDYETSLNLKGNQFVWIPVENPVARSENELDNMVSSNKFPIAFKEYDYYKGVLYDLTYKDLDHPFGIFKGDKNKRNTDNSNNREPDILTMTQYGDSDEFIKNSTKGLYQYSFNKMVENVKKNKGFFVSRYELGNLHGDVPVSKAKQEDISDLSWVDGYNLIKKMYNNKNYSAEMLWGCQYDAIMVWMYYSGVKEKYFVENTDEICNRTFKILPTANSSSYAQKNIYDIIGNVYEFTQEAAYTSSRICRGGSYDYESSVSTNNMLIREQRGIMNEYSNVGFRAYLLF